MPSGPLNPQALNRYSYVLNNPLRYVDPTGHDTLVFEVTFTSDKAWEYFANRIDMVITDLDTVSYVGGVLGGGIGGFFGSEGVRLSGPFKKAIKPAVTGPSPSH